MRFFGSMKTRDVGVFLLLFLISDVGCQMRQNNRRLRKIPMRAAINLKNRIKERIDMYRERNTKSVCYDNVGCFNLPHKNSPLQKMPENPKNLDTKFFLYTRSTDSSKPEIIYYDDDGKSLEKSSFNHSLPLKLIVHGYMTTWNEKGSLIMANAYLKLYDCNVILMDWHLAARGPQYPTAAANTELVGRQLGILLTKMVKKGLDPKNIHLIGFSLGAHVCGTASESLKNEGHLLGRITGLDAASPLFKNNYFREKYKKLDRSDAKFVDVIHTDGSPFVTDGFGLWEPIGHVDFFPNGGQEQPGCNDVKDAIFVSHFERGLSKELVCSHVRAFLLFRESVVNKLERMKGNEDICEFTTYPCPKGITSYEKGQCFPKSKTMEMGQFGEDAVGEGVMFFTTRSSSSYCGSQLQAKLEISSKTGPMSGIVQLQMNHDNQTVTFNINCEIEEYSLNDAEMYGLAATTYKTLKNTTEELRVKLGYLDLAQNRVNMTHYVPTFYFNRISVHDMDGNSWHYCKKNAKVEDTRDQKYGLLTVVLTKNNC